MLSKEQMKDIRIADLEEAFLQIKKSQTDSEWFRELTAIQNAIDFLKNE